MLIFPYNEHQVEEAQTRVDAAVEVNTAAQGRYDAEAGSYAAFLTQMEADNAQIDFELGILD